MATQELLQKMRPVAEGKESAQFRFVTIGRQENITLNQSLDALLECLGKSNLGEELRYILLEFVTNANKSNLKRVYFHSVKLDINNRDDYEKGMPDFAEKFHEHLSEYSGNFSQFGLYTHVFFSVIDGELVIMVRNSNAALPQEHNRVRALVAKSKLVRDAAEAFMSALDNSEGAGLGTISSMLMLRNLGLSEANYSFNPDPKANETAVSVRIPLDTVTEKEASLLSAAIAREIDRLPTFPDNVSRIEKLIGDANVSFDKVSEAVQSDPSITAEILRLVNSAQYMLPQKVSNIKNALSLIGTQGLRGLLYSFGSQQLVGKQYGKLDQLWEHSFRTAAYAYNLAKEFKQPSLRDDAYVGGILHDIGKAIVYHLHPGLLESINHHTSDKALEDEMLERLAIGVSHTRIGSEIAKKWNFPDGIVSVIGFHHQPFLAPDEDQALVKLVYLANMLTRYADSPNAPVLIEPEILALYGLKDEAAVNSLAKKLSTQYEEQKLKAKV